VKITFRRWREPLTVLAVFVVLTAAMTWPQARELTRSAVPHHDVYFNMWRLAWIAHALSTPARLFDANIFYPEHNTLALSDAILVQGVLGAPLFWIGMPAVLVQNLLLLGAIALSGMAMFCLVRYLTNSRGAGILAGIAFAFAPFRFEHAMHMELQWAFWSPLALLAIHRTLDTGRMRAGVMAGLLLALQMLSCIYYGIFLSTLLVVPGVLWLAFDRGVPLRRAMVPLLAGGVLAVAISAIYAIPYLQVHARVGSRQPTEITEFSARPASYLVATPENYVYGRMFAARGAGERRLFPGLGIVLLAGIGLLLVPPTRRQIVSLLALIAAFEASLGFRGYAYGFLYEHVPLYAGLRAPARLGIFVVMFLAVLAGYGYTAIAATLRPRARQILAGVLAAALLIEYRVRFPLDVFPTSVPPLYARLRELPVGIVAEFPVPRADRLPGDDPRVSYMSTFHWFPLVNGYSGMYPPSYIARIVRLQSFPGASSQAQLRADGVRYVVVHATRYPPETLAAVLERLLKLADFHEVGVFDDGEGGAYLYTYR
jgi:hypothetical protein